MSHQFYHPTTESLACTHTSIDGDGSGMHCPSDAGFGS